MNTAWKTGKRNPLPLCQPSMNGEKQLLLKLLAYGVRTGEFHLEDPGEAASAVLFMVEGVKMCSEVMPITEEMLTGIYHQI